MSPVPIDTSSTQVEGAKSLSEDLQLLLKYNTAYSCSLD